MSSFEIGASRPVGAIGLNPVQPATSGAADANSVPGPATASATPQVETSLTTSAGPVPVDQNRVAQIRQAVENGTYPVIPTRISDAMIAAGVLLQKGS
jgi:negative regulator of flagellin synthesis FlgM